MGGLGDFELVVKEYERLGTWLVDNWGALAETVAAQLDSGSMTGKDTTQNLLSAGTLAVQSVALIVSKALDAAAELGGSQHDPVVTHPQPFPAPPPDPNFQPHDRTLQLAGPLVYDLGGDQLDATVVTITPPVLKPGDTGFTLQAVATGHRSGRYHGTVQVLRPNQSLEATVAVFVLV